MSTKSEILFYLNRRIAELEDAVAEPNLEGLYELGIPEREIQRITDNYDKRKASVDAERDALRTAFSFIADHFKE